MSIRADILNALETDFLNITVSNGYNNTINKVIKESASLAQINDADLDCVYLVSLSATQVPNETSLWEWHVGFEVYFSSGGLDANDAGLMRNKAESYIEDIMALFNYPAAVLGLETVESVYIESIEPYDQTPGASIGLVYGIIKITFII